MEVNYEIVLVQPPRGYTGSARFRVFKETWFVLTELTPALVIDAEGLQSAQASDPRIIERRLNERVPAAGFDVTVTVRETGAQSVITTDSSGEFVIHLIDPVIDTEGGQDININVQLDNHNIDALKLASKQARRLLRAYNSMNDPAEKEHQRVVLHRTPTRQQQRARKSFDTVGRLSKISRMSRPARLNPGGLVAGLFLDILIWQVETRLRGHLKVVSNDNISSSNVPLKEEVHVDIEGDYSSDTRSIRLPTEKWVHHDQIVGAREIGTFNCTVIIKGNMFTYRRHCHYRLRNKNYPWDSLEIRKLPGIRNETEFSAVNVIVGFVIERNSQRIRVQLKDVRCESVTPLAYRQVYEQNKTEEFRRRYIGEEWIFGIGEGGELINAPRRRSVTFVPVQ